MSERTPRAARAALALGEEQRRQRRRAAEQDHFERTRHSVVLGGYELGHVKPTAETEARLRPDPIARMVANETLTREQGRAAVEIRDIFERLAAGLLAHTGDLAARTGRGGSPEMPERLALLHAQRYLPWAHYLGGRAAEAAQGALPARPAVQGKCPAALEVAIDVLIDSQPLARCDAARRWRNGTAAKVLAYALAVYTDMAGWERNRDMIAAFEAAWRRRKP
jgi:hypothetical protein